MRTKLELVLLTAARNRITANEQIHVLMVTIDQTGKGKEKGSASGGSRLEEENHAKRVHVRPPKTEEGN